MTDRRVDFVPDEVATVAAALLEDFWYVDEGGRNLYSKCRYCDASAYYCYAKDDGSEIEHDKDCPVLIAKDLLTGIKAPF